MFNNICNINICDTYVCVRTCVYTHNIHIQNQEVFTKNKVFVELVNLTNRATSLF